MYKTLSHDLVQNSHWDHLVEYDKLEFHSVNVSLVQNIVEQAHGEYPKHVVHSLY